MASAILSDTMSKIPGATRIRFSLRRPARDLLTATSLPAAWLYIAWRAGSRKQRPGSRVRRQRPRRPERHRPSRRKSRPRTEPLRIRYVSLRPLGTGCTLPAPEGRPPAALTLLQDSVSFQNEADIGQHATHAGEVG